MVFADKLYKQLSQLKVKNISKGGASLGQDSSDDSSDGDLDHDEL